MSDDRRILRELGEWRPQAIMRRLGPAPSEGHHFPYLMVALVVCHGPERVSELVRRLEAEGRKVAPRLAALGADDPAFAAAAEEIAEQLKQIGGIRSRAANEAKGGLPVGMNGGDLKFLTALIRVVITGLELTKRPTPAGITRTRRLMDTKPAYLDALGWVGRLTPLGRGAVAQLTPDSGRVVVAFVDGRLAYDPVDE